jgi:hypothetical protein
MRHYVGTTVVMVLAFGASGCSVPEPGSPALSPTPLFPGYQSYRTVDEVRSGWKDRTPVTVLSDQKVPAQGRCPRFDELTVQISARDEQHVGSLTLTFINDRLKATAFQPKDFDGYVRQLAERGVVRSVGHGEEGHAEPATTIWITDLPSSERRFVGWRDERLSAQVLAWTRACS